MIYMIAPCCALHKEGLQGQNLVHINPASATSTIHLLYEYNWPDLTLRFPMITAMAPEELPTDYRQYGDAFSEAEASKLLEPTEYEMCTSLARTSRAKL